MNSETKPVLILGTGSFAIEIADVISEIPGIVLAGFVENMERSHCAEPLVGKPVYWVDELARMATTHRVVCGLGTTHRRKFIRQAEAFGCEFATIVHTTARVSRTAKLGPGTVVSAGVIIAAYTELGAHVIVNRAATIGHHTRVGDFVTIGPGVNLAGNCHIADAVYIGIGATIIDHVSIGPCAVVGAGAVVTEDVPERVLVVGVPAKILKRDIAGK